MDSKLRSKARDIGNVIDELIDEIDSLEKINENIEADNDTLKERNEELESEITDLKKQLDEKE